MPDFRIPARYLGRNFEWGDRLAVVQIDQRQGPGSAEQALRYLEQVISDRYLAHLRAANANGKNIYVSMNPVKAEATGRTKSDIATIRHVYLDLDKGGERAVERLLSSEKMPGPHEILETSPDKYQVIWRVEGFDPQQAEALMRQLAQDYGGDPAATDATRVLRVPGFRNWKYEEPHYVREMLTATDSKGNPHHGVWTPADFPRIEERPASWPAQRTGDRQTPIGSGVDQSVKDFAYALRQLEQGTDPSVIRSRIADFRSGDGKHPNVEGYAARTVAAAQQHYLRRGGGMSSSVTASETREESSLER